MLTLIKLKKKNKTMIFHYSTLNKITFGENKQARVTLADRLIVTDIDVIRSGTWFAVPKYKGTKANQITHVVYIVKPIDIIIYINIYYIQYIT